jgi:hypothetical protein
MVTLLLRVRIPAGVQTILTEDFQGFLQALQENSGDYLTSGSFRELTILRPPASPAFLFCRSVVK